MSIRKNIGMAAAVLIAATSGEVAAAEIESLYTQLSAVVWTVDFKVVNGVSDASLTEWTVFFDQDKYRNIQVTASPIGWDSLAIQGDTFIPASGYFDSLALMPTDAISPGATLAGFQAKFEFFETGQPAALAFDILDANFQTIQSGFTTVTSLPSVPEPATGILMAAALGLGFLWRRRMEE